MTKTPGFEQTASCSSVDEKIPIRWRGSPRRAPKIGSTGVYNDRPRKSEDQCGLSDFSSQSLFEMAVRTGSGKTHFFVRSRSDKILIGEQFVQQHLLSWATSGCHAQRVTWCTLYKCSDFVEHFPSANSHTFLSPDFSGLNNCRLWEIRKSQVVETKVANCGLVCDRRSA